MARDVGKRPRSLSHDGLGSRQSQPRETERDAGEPGSRKAVRQPACIGEQRGHHRCQRHSQIAEHAVHADGAARLVAGGVHQHGGADRMVDRREQSSGRERDRQHHRRTGKRRRRHREAGAEKEQRHQRRPADALRNPPLRQREQPVEQEHARGERQDRPIRVAKPPVRHRHCQHRGGQDQQRIVGEAMRGIDESDQACVRCHVRTSSTGVAPGPKVGCLTFDVRPSFVSDRTPCRPLPPAPVRGGATAPCRLCL